MPSLKSSISWCTGTLNVSVGCDPVSAGCDHCYAAEIVGNARYRFPAPFNQVVVYPERLKHLRRMRPSVDAAGTTRPYLCFVNSMSDFWHDAIPEPVIHQALDAFEACPLTVFQILTKRPIRARRILRARYGTSGVPSHIWIGVSVEDNRVAARLNILRDIKERTGGAMTAFVSVEPIVGPTDAIDFAGIDWAIFGGESGPRARIMEYDWLKRGIDAAFLAGAAIWFKQFGLIQSNPLLNMAPEVLNGRRAGIKARFQWLIDNGLELLGDEKGGATLDGKTWRELPMAWHRMVKAMNAGPEAALL